MTLALDQVELLFGHTDEDSALLVDDYPYGRTIRTQIRYWIETNPKHGDRFCSQTKNPKTGRWNKPKKSVYTGVGVMYVEPDTGHIKWTGTNFNDSAERIALFLGVVGKGRLNDDQRRKVIEIIGYTRAMAKVTWTVTSTSGETETQRVQREARQHEQERMLGQLVAIETHYAGKAMAADA